MIRAKYAKTRQERGHWVKVWHDAFLVAFDHQNDVCLIAVPSPDSDGYTLERVKRYDLKVYLRTEIPLFDKEAT